MGPTTLLAASLSAASAADLMTQDLGWTVVNDTVMGGRSAASVEDLARGVRFSGELSLENNGGFASMRSRPATLGLAGTAGLAVTVAGDGRPYLLTARRADVPLRAGSYRAPIPTVAGETTVVELPWSAFEATSFGRPVPQAPPLATGLARIDSLGLMLADGQPGAFSVDLLSVAPMADARAADGLDQPTRTRVTAAFQAAIRLGVPAFNRGEAGRCAAHYQTAIESALLMGEGGLSQAEADALGAALLTAGEQADRDAAWTLRRAMDAWMAGAARSGPDGG